MSSIFNVDRRSFLKIGSAVGAGVLLGNPSVWAGDQDKKEKTKPDTNVSDVLAEPRTPHSLPGPFPGRVVEVIDPAAMANDEPSPDRVRAMFEKGIRELTGREMRESFDLLFTGDDVIGIKVNPVGAGLINTRLELVDAIVAWLTDAGVPRANLVIWDRFDSMLTDAGFTEERYPGVGIEGLQTIGEAVEGEAPSWLDPEGNHVSAGNFDENIFYWADVDGPKDEQYMNQHVFNGKRSPFGRLLTERLTKIVNVPVFKNTGNGISMATKNMGYGAICNTGRLHQPLFFDVCTEVLAFPAIRDKMVLNVTDGLRAQYDGGPMPNAQATWLRNSLHFATDLIAIDAVCHDQMVEKRKEMGVEVNEHPRYTEYLHYAEELGLGVADREKIVHVKA